ncbi:hypothetical protein OF83DRAFT_1179655 [Amylostereum chailletii]|nr:hypothetical protein OF83DRAFT_1179655 [Amylostereum chailletii]
MEGYLQDITAGRAGDVLLISVCFMDCICIWIAYSKYKTSYESKGVKKKKITIFVRGPAPHSLLPSNTIDDAFKALHSRHLLPDLTRVRYGAFHAGRLKPLELGETLEANGLYDLSTLHIRVCVLGGAPLRTKAPGDRAPDDHRATTSKRVFTESPAPGLDEPPFPSGEWDVDSESEADTHRCLCTLCGGTKFLGYRQWLEHRRVDYLRVSNERIVKQEHNDVGQPSKPTPSNVKKSGKSAPTKMDPRLSEKDKLLSRITELSKELPMRRMAFHNTSLSGLQFSVSPSEWTTDSETQPSETRPVILSAHPHNVAAIKYRDWLDNCTLSLRTSGSRMVLNSICGLSVDRSGFVLASVQLVVHLCVNHPQFHAESSTESIIAAIPKSVSTVMARLDLDLKVLLHAMNL